jgi:arylsulfatase A-like enzyme
VPHSSDALGDIDAFHNHYRNSVRLQERTISAFVRELRAMPCWKDTVMIFLSDHGEQFREHGGLYHNHSLFDEELRVPGWMVAGARALTREQRAAIRTYAGFRTYAQDVHATLVDLLGIADARGTLPLASLIGGRSLLRPRVAADEPAVLLSTSTAVWKSDDARYGVMQASRLIVGAPWGSWTCFDTERDPGERDPLTSNACGTMQETASSAFAGVQR